MIPGPGIMKASAFASAATIQIGDQKEKNKQSCSEYVWILDYYNSDTHHRQRIAMP